MSLSTEHNAKRCFFEKRLFVSTRPVLSISSTAIKGSISKNALLTTLAQKYGLLCVSRQGDSSKLVFATKAAQNAALEYCRSQGIDAKPSDPPSAWNAPFGLESFASSEDRHFFIECLDLTVHSKTFESDQLVHQDWDHNYRWFALVRQLRYPPGGFFVSQDVLATIESIEAHRRSRPVGQDTFPVVEGSREDQDIGEETLVHHESEEIAELTEEISRFHSPGSPSKRQASSPPTDSQASLRPDSTKRSRSSSPKLLAPAPFAPSVVAALEATASPRDHSPASHVSLEARPVATSETLPPVRSVSSAAVAASFLTPPPSVHLKSGLPRPSSAPIRGVPIQVPQNVTVSSLPLAPPDTSRPAPVTSSRQLLVRPGLVDTLVGKEVEGLVKTWGPVTSILRIPQETATRIVGLRGQTVKLMVEKSQVGIQILPSLQAEWSLIYLAGSKRGDDKKAIDLISARMREIGRSDWSSEKNFVALS